jgi:hypothetical protein
MTVDEAYENFFYNVREPKTQVPYSTVLLYSCSDIQKLHAMEAVFKAGWDARYQSLTTKDI